MFPLVCWSNPPTGENSRNRVNTIEGVNIVQFSMIQSQVEKVGSGKEGQRESATMPRRIALGKHWKSEKDGSKGAE